MGSVSCSPDLQSSDADLRQRVVNFLAGKNMPGLRRLDVQVESGVLTISGRLATFYEKQLALSCCRRVAGVRDLVDEVEV